MTKITFYKKNNKFFGIECNGHAGYAQNGYDIVCSAISVLCGNLRLGLEKILALNATFEQDDETGYFKLSLKEFEDESAQVLFRATYHSMLEIANDYPKFVQVKLKGE